ncbi:hypothetical protein ROHU_006317 [Labeo rohita]|uniref:Uncharacterized protein n=1 Tax=Labeo rohita TaxID=84645 RepID=A0A498N615_LABRO|nr:hypothetical protein ROHU_006317 [Labeo rohita]
MPLLRAQTATAQRVPVGQQFQKKLRKKTKKTTVDVQITSARTDLSTFTPSPVATGLSHFQEERTGSSTDLKGNHTLTLNNDTEQFYEISVTIGEKLKLDVLLTNTKKVVHQNKISTEWMVVWKRRGVVKNDQLTVSDGNRTINALTVNDAGTYRALDFDNEILITVTVTGSSTDSKGNHRDDDKTDDTEQFYEISVTIGEKLKLDVLLTNTKKVVHQNKINTEWMVVWKRRGGVKNDQLTVSDGNRTINALTVNDAGTYRALDFDNEILITVTVTGSSTDSKGNHRDDDKTDDTEQFCK